MKQSLVNGYEALRSLSLNFLRRCLYSSIGEPSVYRNILVVRKGTLGDHIVAEPIYLGIQKYFENASLDLFTSVGHYKETSILGLPQKKYFREVFFFEDTHITKHREHIRNQKYDLVIELPQELDSNWVLMRNMLFFRLCGIKRGIGWFPGNHYLFKTWQFQHRPFQRMWKRFAGHLNRQGMRHPFEEIYSQYDGSEHTIDLPKNYIVIAPLAKYASKMWPTVRFQELSERLLRMGYSIVLLGDREIGDFPEHTALRNLMGKTTVQELQSIIKNAALVICNDSAPMHIAYSNQVPLIALFGARNFPQLWWPPQWETIQVLFKPEKSGPFAFISGSSKNSITCSSLLNISVEEVLESAEIMLNKN